MRLFRQLDCFSGEYPSSILPTFTTDESILILKTDGVGVVGKAPDGADGALVSSLATFSVPVLASLMAFSVAHTTTHGTERHQRLLSHSRSKF